MPHIVRILAGLGNPGDEYIHTRHNLGFLVIDQLALDLRVSPWRTESGCLVAEVKGVEPLVLVKPQSYMNTSGGPLSKLMRKRKLSASELLVIHDEIDLAPGICQLKWGGGLNAHNGLRSIADKLTTRDFGRARVGFGRPPGKMDVASYVLREVKGAQWKELEANIMDAADTIREALEHPDRASWH